MLDGVSDSQPSTGFAGTAAGVFAGVSPARSLWLHQERAVRAFNADQATGDRSTYLVVPPGGGKTIIGLGAPTKAGTAGVHGAALGGAEAEAAKQALGENAIAITADSASIPESHKRDAEAFVREFGIRHEYVETHEFENPDYVKNDANRCFHCKDELFTVLERVAGERGFSSIVYGVNRDDLGDYRPGQRAAKLHEVKAPLVDAGLSKAEIRELSRVAGLPTWDRPASPCLSSRFPYGTQITPQGLRQVEEGERLLHAMGFAVARVRYHGDVARIEVEADQIPHLLDPDLRATVDRELKRLGFRFVTVDLKGFRSGSLNEGLVAPQSPPPA